MPDTPKAPQHPVTFLHLLPVLLRACAVCKIEHTRVLPCGLENLGPNERRQVIDANSVIAAIGLATQLTWEESDQRHFPIVFADSFSFSYLGDFKVYLLSCLNLKQARSLLSWLPPFISPTLRFEVIEQPGSVAIRLQHRPPLADVEHLWALNETIFATTHSVIKSLGIGEHPVLTVRFRHAPHAHVHQMERHMGCKVEFHQEHDEFIISQVFRDAPIPSANEAVQKIISERYEKLWPPKAFNDLIYATLLDSVDLPPKIKKNAWVIHLMAEYEKHPEIITKGIVGCSNALKVHPRTLQKRLAEIGCSFRMLEGVIRHAYSKRLLSTTSMSLEEVAASVGIKDLRTFNISFKDKEGISPKDWKMRLPRHGPSFPNAPEQK